LPVDAHWHWKRLTEASVADGHGTGRRDQEGSWLARGNGGRRLHCLQLPSRGNLSATHMTLAGRQPWSRSGRKALHLDQSRRQGRDTAFATYRRHARARCTKAEGWSGILWGMCVPFTLCRLRCCGTVAEEPAAVETGDRSRPAGRRGPPCAGSSPRPDAHASSSSSSGGH
jgi:hypothetical protein